MKPEQRKQEIQKIMDELNVPEDEAEFILAVELGEVTGDEIEVETDGSSSQNSQ